MVERETLGDLAARIVADGREVVQAEVGVWKATAAWRLSGIKRGLPLLVVALFLLQAVATASLVGVMMVLGPVIGIGWAVLLVLVVTLIVIGLLAWLGIRALGSLWAPLAKDGE